MNDGEKVFQTIELAQADDFMTGLRVYKLMRYTRNRHGRIIKREYAEPIEIVWKELPEGGCVRFVMQFATMEMEDSWKKK